jgi:pantoate--beta-alanine ligase
MLNILRTREATRSTIKTLQNSGKKVGFVPTMGALHEGHLELVRNAKASSDIVVVSIFVNPLQFNNPEDFKKYPISESADLALLENAGVEIAFIPDYQEIYPQKPKMNIFFGALEEKLEGAFRPGHFGGVGIIVSKLLNIVNPDILYLGQKDLQQVAVIRQLISELSFPVDLVVVPTQRESDGLAMSSRNLRLKPNERKSAVLLFNLLNMAKSELLEGKNWFQIREKVESIVAGEPLARLEYFELVTTSDLQILNELKKDTDVSICIAMFIGEVRLIDNLSVID